MKQFLLLAFLATCFSSLGQNISAEEAIKNVLVKESASWRSGDVKAHAECWYVQPYSRILVSTADGKVIDVPVSFMITPPPGSMGKGGTSPNSNYKMNISGKNAWVSHDEESIAADGTKTYSSEFRILELIDGHWKLVGQSIMIRKS
jgi:hypothetical protein